ncbi:MAG: cytochrome c3 family protein [Slackia isoflavoniconvertens]|nr:cytochrome c3 family protein [Slackia isoflavoniconvertens]
MKDSAQAETVKAEKVGKKRWPVVVSVIVAVLVVAGIGGFAWHNTPSFCGTVCHSSMSEHVDNYYGADGTNGAGLAHWHGVNAGTTCLDCHKADINTQVAELGSQLSGDTDNLGLADRYYVDNDTCLSCHGDSYEALAEQTADLEPYNPHDSPHGQLNCNECHKGHAQQVDTCGQCHPNGGQTMRGTN